MLAPTTENKTAAEDAIKGLLAKSGVEDTMLHVLKDESILPFCWAKPVFVSFSVRSAVLVPAFTCHYLPSPVFTCLYLP